MEGRCWLGQKRQAVWGPNKGGPVHGPEPTCPRVLGGGGEMRLWGVETCDLPGRDRG